VWDGFVALWHGGRKFVERPGQGGMGVVLEMGLEVWLERRGDGGMEVRGVMREELGVKWSIV